MASPARRRPENEAGDLFVDDTCIDCDTCRWMAPETFTRDGGMSVVHAQPEDAEARRRALRALVACPTASIGTMAPAPELKDVRGSFPVPVDGPVGHCGYHSERSFGAASWFIQRPGGNVLVDSPRFAKPLVESIEALGGVRWMFLTHRDDVADHEKFADRFGCERILHADDVTADTQGVEWTPEGEAAFMVDDGLKAIPVPGHTKGHMVLLHEDTHLFTGDHLAWSDRLGHLYAFRGACWYSWDALKGSMARLADERFTWVLPGHGRLHHDTAESMHGSLVRCLEWMETV